MTDNSRGRKIHRYQSALGEIAYWAIGSENPKAKTLVFLHGWPFNAQNYRKLIPRLTTHCNLVFVDMPGMGQSRFDPIKGKNTNFTTVAASLSAFLHETFTNPVILVAHDTGATIARLMLAEHNVPADSVDSLICFCTEMPGHRPPFIPLFQKLTVLPFAVLSFGLLLKSKLFLHSRLGFKNCFSDQDQITEHFLQATIGHLLNNSHQTTGLVRYLRGIDWAVVDRLHAIHAKITQPVHFILGTEDKIFPYKKAMTAFKSYQGQISVSAVEGGGFLLFEEHPNEAANEIMSFMENVKP